jgi:hypothetical protein
VTWWRRVVNGLCPDRNPLRRPVDRFESMLVLGLLAVFLVATPLIAFGVGRWAWDGATSTARTEQAAWHRVTAVVLEGVPAPKNDPYGAIYLAQVPVRWIARDGTSHTGRVAAAAGLRTGAKVTVWTSPSGQLTGPPLGRAQIAHQAAFAGLLAVLGFSILLSVTALVTRRMLQRRRMAAWDAEWRATGPSWSNYR